MLNEDTYSLDSVVDQMFIHKMVDKRKYYDAYLSAARWVWKDLFKNTILSEQSVWQMVKQDENGLYIDIPSGAKRLFSVSVTDHRGKIVQLYYNQEMNVVPKPTTNCSCDCGGVPSSETDWVKTSKFTFTNGGVDYYTYTWLRMLPSGDIQQWIDLPVKRYNNLIGDNNGDHNSDYNADYNVGSGFSDYTIIRETSSVVICQLKVRPCGCPDNTPQNQSILDEFCCGFKRHHNKQDIPIYADLFKNGKGGVKIGDCQTQIRYFPHVSDCRQGKIPDYLLVNFQTNGEKCGTYVQVPEYAMFAMWAGIEYILADLMRKTVAKSQYDDRCRDIIAYLNILSLSRWSKIQDTRVKW